MSYQFTVGAHQNSSEPSKSVSLRNYFQHIFVKICLILVDKTKVKFYREEMLTLNLHYLNLLFFKILQVDWNMELR